MPSYNVYNLSGINTSLNPLLSQQGEVTRAVNVTDFPIGGFTKRPGYITYLGTANGSAVDSLLNFTLNNGTQFWNYRVSGGIIYYSTQGTGAWSIAGNGTMTAGNRVRSTILNNTMIVGDGAAATRHTTDGTSFSNTSGAPVAAFFEQFQNRIYAGGTASTLFYSTTGDPTNWSTTGTSDSSSFTIPGAGKINGVFKLADRIIATKNSNLIYRWDGFQLVDTATALGPTSADSFAKTEGIGFWLNRQGFFASGGDAPQLISNPIRRQIYNDKNEGITGGTFDNATGVVHTYDYYCSIGTVTDDLTDETIDNCVAKYNYQTGNWVNYQYAVNPTAWLSYKDASGVQQLIFGDSSGQCYQVAGTANDDNGSTIGAAIEFFVHGGDPALDKKWNWFTAFFSPGCQAQLQVATSDTFTKGKKRWLNLGDAQNGVVEFRFPSDTRSKLLYCRIIEASRNARFNFYGFNYSFDPIPRN